MTNVLIRTLWLTMQLVPHFVCLRLHSGSVLFQVVIMLSDSGVVAHIQTVSSLIGSTCCTSVRRKILLTQKKHELVVENWRRFGNEIL